HPAGTPVGAITKGIPCSLGRMVGSATPELFGRSRFGLNVAGAGGAARAGTPEKRNETIRTRTTGPASRYRPPRALTEGMRASSSGALQRAPVQASHADIANPLGLVKSSEVGQFQVGSSRATLPHMATPNRRAFRRAYRHE